jgi:hypothetical protein
MKASDLRIGNFVNNKGRLDIVTCLEHVTFEDITNVRGQYYEVFIPEPIPLTEEWLLKFGFGKNDNNQFILMEGSVDILFNKDLNGWTCDGINFSINMTEHVHQLQNLYFALTGEELEIKA